ncbi:Monooxygenase [Apiospora phragmitis]|uniref:Monooxygenase n=1 Tax=Apiospora phragmitis TaxID=2905665 RepID=A0ABR1TE19_9PEZI
MQLLHLLSASSLVSAAAALGPRQASSGCANPEKRVEFRSLDAAAQKEYTDAVMCLATKPSGLGLNLNTTLYDDFTYVHTHLNKIIHFCAMFLLGTGISCSSTTAACASAATPAPWPTGTGPWTPTTRPTHPSGTWSAATAARIRSRRRARRSGCALTDGPFKDLRPAYNEVEYAPHCLSRDFFDGKDRPGTMRGSAYNAAEVKFVNERETYADFRLYLESIPHGSIHSAVGGQKGDMKPSSSPNDPLFFLHHTQIDRLWALWQQANPEARDKDINDDKVNPVDGSKATLEDVLPFMGLAADIKISEVMTTQNDLLCYTY